MTPTPVCAEPDLNLGGALRTLRVHDIRQMPVAVGGRLCGVVTENDIKLARGMRLCNEVSLADIMDENPQTAPPEASVESVVRDLFDFKAEFCLVVRDTGEVLGIFPRQDALGLMLGEPRMVAKTYALPSKKKPALRAA